MAWVLALAGMALLMLAFVQFAMAGDQGWLPYVAAVFGATLLSEAAFMGWKKRG